ncbi:MAG TPA: trehalase family glycosidase [Pyrinomonadaceae bacterium]|nr:trehalase family glycosidase [Pyrinomonadaceae bacterium]
MPRLSKRLGAAAASLAVVLLAAWLAPAAAAQGRATPEQLEAARAYIRRSWRTLSRSNRDLAAAAVDPKFDRPVPNPPPGPQPPRRWPVYVSSKEDLSKVEASLRAQMPPGDFERISLRQLPAGDGTFADDRGRDLVNLEPGLLYLPRPYVVPGGRFNEMYGWDSYFIQVGLLRDGETRLARDMVENFLYEVEHYGKILNANRTYYLGRSQPPFLTRMILGVYEKEKDNAWLRRALPAVESYYRYWTTGDHLTVETGLSRYYEFGTSPAPEVIADERDSQGRTHYDRVKEFYRAHEVTDYDVSRFYQRSSDLLTPAFYIGDRSMRESGFDPSNRFGPFSVDITSYNPVCLNSLLYVMERDAARITRELGLGREAREWERRARLRAERVKRLMWDERDGLFYDYDFRRKQVRRYPFVTTFYPLWAGIATPRQAARVVSNLRLFERPGGLRTSTNVSGSQWDAPFGWAPMQLIAVEGLRRYGFDKEADRVSVNFLSLVLKEFVEHNVIVEKYDVERRDSQLGAGLRFGYTSNEIGFGWTNAAFTELYARLPAGERPKVLEAGGLPAPPLDRHETEEGICERQQRGRAPARDGGRGVRERRRPRRRVRRRPVHGGGQT